MRYKIVFWLFVINCSCSNKNTTEYSSQVFCEIINAPKVKEFLHLDFHNGIEEIKIYLIDNNLVAEKFTCNDKLPAIKIINGKGTEEELSSPLVFIVDKISKNKSIYHISMRYIYEGLIIKVDISEKNNQLYILELNLIET